MSKLILPGQQQQSQLGIAINDLDGPVVLVITSGPLMVQIPFASLEKARSMAGVIGATIDQVEQNRAAIADAVRFNGQLPEMDG